MDTGNAVDTFICSLDMYGFPARFNKDVLSSLQLCNPSALHCTQNNDGNQSYYRECYDADRHVIRIVVRKS